MRPGAADPGPDSTRPPALPTVAQLRARAADLAALWKCPRLLDQLEIRYNARMRSRLGVAWLDRNRLDLNLRLLRAHPHEALPTFVHELAHLAVARLYPGRSVRPHGHAWRILMAAAGVAPERTHELDVEHLVNGGADRVFVHVCVRCGARRTATRARRDYICRRCGPGTIRVHERDATPRTAEADASA